MKTQTLLTSLLVAMILSAGCAGKSSEIVDETEGADKTTKTVQGDTAGAKTTDNGTITSDSKEADSKDLSGQDQDQNVQEMTAADETVESIYFDYDKFNIRADMQETVEKNAVILNNDTNKNFRIKIEGNCDEWGSDEYNYALGLRRANSAKKALVAQGFKGDRVTLVSLGEANPVCTEKTQECWQKNRRADFKVLP